MSNPKGRDKVLASSSNFLFTFPTGGQNKKNWSTLKKIGQNKKILPQVDRADLSGNHAVSCAAGQIFYHQLAKIFDETVGQIFN